MELLMVLVVAGIHASIGLGSRSFWTEGRKVGTAAEVLRGVLADARAEGGQGRSCR
jgi:Tfp pilus assembly protein FimT